MACYNSFALHKAALIACGIIPQHGIDQIFESCEDLIAGKFISGAGGGGFLQVILKKGVTKEHLRRRLRNVFQDSGVDMWESEFLW